MVVNEELKRIKRTNEEEFTKLMFAAHLYHENEKKETPNDVLKEGLLAYITGILDKYGVKYINDLI